MPDLAVPYTLVTPVDTIVFNDGTADQFYITDIPQGLVQAPVRAPQDPKSFANGGRSYNFWKGARHILIEGIFLVTSVETCSPALLTVWNTMEEQLRAALESIAALDTDTGTLGWTPTGLTARTLTVRSEVELECPPDQNYLVRAFHFGLLADDPDWT
jgi:hypothetical protein